MKYSKELIYYFGYTLSQRVGIGHISCTLDVLCQEALLLERRAILVPAYLCPLHNRGVLKITAWDTYFDLRKYGDVSEESHKKGSLLTIAGDVPTDSLTHLNETRLQRNLSGQLWVHQFGSFLPEKYKSLNRISRWYLPNYRNFANPPLWDNLSKRIHKLAYVIKKRLGDFYSLHVRRNDVADACTEPEKVKEFLRKNLPTDMPVFLISDERDENYYNELKIEFNLISELDIPEFVNIWEEEQDNYLIYLIAETVRSLAIKDLGTLAPKQYCDARTT